MNDIIRFEQVTKAYGDQVILKAFDLKIRKGEFLTVIGSSGSGKTTMLKLINGLSAPTQGKIYIDGKDISQENQTLLRRNIGYVIQGIGLFPHMTVRKNIAYVPSLLNQHDKERTRKGIRGIAHGGAAYTPFSGSVIKTIAENAENNANGKTYEQKHLQNDEPAICHGGIGQLLHQIKDAHAAVRHGKADVFIQKIAAERRAQRLKDQNQRTGEILFSEPKPIRRQQKRRPVPAGIAALLRKFQKTR